MSIAKFSRAEWAELPTAGYSMPDNVDKFVVHHFFIPDVPASAPLHREMDELRGVAKFHYRKWGYGATGYNFVVFDSGNSFEGQGVNRSGAHTKGQNTKSYGVAIAINGDQRPPTDAAWREVARIRWKLVDTGKLSENHKVYGHTDFSEKSCPGHRTYPLLEEKLVRPAGTGDFDTMDSKQMQDLADRIAHAIWRKNGRYVIDSHTNDELDKQTALLQQLVDALTTDE